MKGIYRHSVIGNMPSTLYPVLSQKNHHERDDQIVFEEEGHKYTILNDPDSTYTSVTTWNHSHFDTFDADKIVTNMMKGSKWKKGHKYWGKTAEEIKQQWSDAGKQASQLGTQMHYEIECFMNRPDIPYPYQHQDLLQKPTETEPNDTATAEWKHFMAFIHDTPHLRPYRTEWCIYDEELKLAGSVDMVYENTTDGSLMIYDWKRTKEIIRVSYFNRYAKTDVISHLPDTNFWHYALQLNTYKRILEEKYGKTVSDLRLVRLHPEEETYEIIEVPLLKQELDDLHALRRMNPNPTHP